MKNIIYILCITLFMFSCNREEFLDIQPKGIIIPTKTLDYRLLLDQKDRSGSRDFSLDIISPGFAEHYNNTFFASDDVELGDEVFAAQYTEDNSLVKTFIWSDNIFTEDQEDRGWQNIYGNIYVANIVIEEVLDSQGGTLEEKLALKAEAHAHRALNYFSLVNLYALHYDPSTASSEPGVPLRLGTEIEGLSFPRATVETVYSLVFQDLNEALENLPETPQELIHRPSKAGVYALLARIYLYMGEFEKARDNANLALGLTNTLVDYNTAPGFFANIINLGDEEDDPEIIWHKTSPNEFLFTPLSAEYVNLLDPNDQRINLFTSVGVFGIPGPQSTYLGGFPRGHIPMGPSVSEMLLTRAECNARLNNISLAVDDLNTLREKRMTTGTFVPETSTDPAEVLQLVKTERRIELLLSGQRLFDLKRYNVYDTPKINLTHTVNGNTFTLQAGSKNWALPIARKYILQSPEMGENIRD